MRPSAIAQAPKKTARRDPRPTALDATEPVLAIHNKDPKRFYLLVYKADQNQGVEYREFQGYTVVIGTKGGPRWAMGATPENQPLERLGHVLMSISAADHARLEEHGAFGGGGRAEARAMEDMIFSRRGAIDNDLPADLEGADGATVASFGLSPVERSVE